MRIRRLRARALRRGALAAAAAFLGAPVHADDSIEVSFTAEAEWAIDLEDGRSSKLELIGTPELEVWLDGDTRVVGIVRLRADAFDRLTPGDGRPGDYSRGSRPLRTGSRLEAELRELYVDLRLARADVRIGKQQIVWGKSDGLKVLDVVNPQDFREFILDDFDDSRIPLWSVNAERRFGPVNLQLVWIPDPTVHELPRPDAQFAFTSPLLVPAPPPPGVAVITRSRSPRRILRDSDAGLRLSSTWRGLDWTLNYLYRHDDVPVFSRTLPAAPGEPVVVEIRYVRSPLLGASWSKAVGDWVARGELATSLDRRFPSTRLADPDGLVKTRETSYVLGLDWYGLSDTLVSAQLFQSTLAGSHRDELARDDTESTLTLFVRRQFARDTWSVELAGLHSLDRGDGLWRLRLRHALRDDLSVMLGTDLFHGDREGLFGEFDRRDRIFVNVELRL